MTSEERQQKFQTDYTLHFQPIRSTTQIWIVTLLQNGISALIFQTSFGGETSTVVLSRNVNFFLSRLREREIVSILSNTRHFGGKRDSRR